MSVLKGSHRESKSASAEVPKELKYADLNFGHYVWVTKAGTKKGSLLGNIAKTGDIIHTVSYIDHFIDKKWIRLWYGDVANTEGLGSTRFILPDSVLVEGTEKEYYAVHGISVKEQLAKGNLWLPTGTGHCYCTGSDPEIFVVNKDGDVIPAWEFLGPEDQEGRRPTKQKDIYNPARMIEVPGNHLIPFWDGFQAEFNIDPGGCHAQRVDQIHSQLKRVLQLARDKFKDARLTSRSVLDISPKVLMEISKEHAELGCSPSKNVYDAPPLKVGDGRELPFRFAGFHIHFGCSHDANLPERIKFMDKIAGIASVSLLHGIDDSRRRGYYGRAGEYRMPKHGLEWRVLSSTAMCHPAVTNLLLDLARLAQGLPLNTSYKDLWEVKGGEERIQHIINNYDEVEARKVLKENDAMFKAIIKSLYATNRGNEADYDKLPAKVEALIMEGCRNFFETDNMSENWHLESNQRWTTHSGGKDESVATFSFEKV